MFKNHDESHEHSLIVLNALYQYDDFMASIRSMIDLGCGYGKDVEWWATRTVRDDPTEPLNIQCWGLDLHEGIHATSRYTNVRYQQQDFEHKLPTPPGGFDVLWCHNAFQYAINPLATLANWKEVASEGAMLCISVPQTTNTYAHEIDFTQESGVLYHYTVVNLIHLLALAGWDCKSGFFRKDPNDQWLHAVVYKTNHVPRDPKTTTWYELAEANLLPESAAKCINAKGFLDQKDLVLPWLDKSLHWFGR